jgi:hypothetical protein
MMSRTLSLLAAGILLTPAILSAQPFRSFGTAGGWTIFHNEATRGCFMERETPNGIIMQVGTEAAMLGKGSDLPFGFLALYAPDRMGATGAGGEVRFSLGGVTFRGDAVGVIREGYRGGYVVANNPWFAEEVADQQTMVVHPETSDAVTIDLTGTRAAMAEVRACQAAHGG